MRASTRLYHPKSHMGSVSKDLLPQVHCVTLASTSPSLGLSLFIFKLGPQHSFEILVKASNGQVLGFAWSIWETPWPVSSILRKWPPVIPDNEVTEPWLPWAVLRLQGSVLRWVSVPNRFHIHLRGSMGGLGSGMSWIGWRQPTQHAHLSWGHFADISLEQKGEDPGNSSMVAINIIQGARQTCT